MADFSEMNEARRILGLGETATLNEIKSVYRSLAKSHHPDKQSGSLDDGNEIMKRLNWAYGLLMDYCDEYRFSFRQEDVARVYRREEDYRNWHDRWSGSV